MRTDFAGSGQHDVFNADGTITPGIPEGLTAGERATVMQTDAGCKAMRLYDAALARAEAMTAERHELANAIADHWRPRVEAADLRVTGTMEQLRLQERCTIRASDRALAAESRLAEATALLRMWHANVVVPGTLARLEAFLSAAPAPAAESEPDRALDACDEAERHCAAADQADDDRIATLELGLDSAIGKCAEKDTRIATLESELAAAREKAAKDISVMQDLLDIQSEDSTARYAQVKALRAAIDAAVKELELRRKTDIPTPASRAQDILSAAQKAGG